MGFSISLLTELLIIGGLVGFLTGLFGIGGGVFLVPTLLYLFMKEGIAVELATPMALGTSLGIAFIASLATTASHIKMRSFDPKIATAIVVSGIFGAQFGALAGSRWDPIIVHRLFGMIVSLIGIYILIFQITEPGEQIYDRILWTKAIVIGFSVSFFSGLLGIGGGSMMIPLLILFLEVPYPKAVGTSTLFMAVASLSGAAGYVFNGWQRAGLPTYTLGYIHVGVLLITGITILLVAKFGVAISHRASPRILARILAGLLLFIGIRTLYFT